MRTLLLALLLSGCAVGRIPLPDGRVMEGYAIGYGKLELCNAPHVCATIKGGPFSKSFSEFLGNAATAVGAYFGVGVI